MIISAAKKMWLRVGLISGFLSLYSLRRCEGVKIESSRASNEDVFEGNIRVGGVMYSMSCQCEKGRREEQSLFGSVDLRVKSCLPAREVTIHEERRVEGAGLSAEEVEDYYGQPHSFMFSDVNRTSFVCSDDRWSSAVLAAPGGEFGEFLLGLSVWEGLVYPEKLSLENITGALTRYIVASDRPFSWCTDEEALSHFEQELGAQWTGGTAPSTAGMRSRVKALLSSSPRNQGDRHLRAILSDLSSYHLNAVLFENLMSAMLELLWTSPSDEPVIKVHSLSGASNPGAVLDVRESDGCHSKGLGALVRPRVLTLEGDFVQAVTINGAAIAVRRQELSEFLALESGFNATKILNRISSRAEEWYEHTIAHTYSVPIYTLTLSD